MLKPNVLTVEFLSHQFHLCFYQRMSRLGKTKNTLLMNTPLYVFKGKHNCFGTKPGVCFDEKLEK